MRKLFFWIIMIFMMGIILFIASELLLSLIFNKRIYQYDAELGWIPKSNFYYNKDVKDVAGETYNIEVSTNRYGFREWGDTSANKIKILLIGDSFTGDLNMSDESSYFGQVKTLLNAEVFAFGGGGYGNFQELIILKKYVKLINPDIFILQFCSNDFVNNSYFLEGRSIVTNQKNLRPYLDENKIIYRLPKNHWWLFLYKNSKVFKAADRVLQHIRLKQRKSFILQTDSNSEKVKEEEKIAIKTTSQILKMMSASVPEHTKLLTFHAGGITEKQKKTWINISKEAGFIPLPIVNETLKLAEQQGSVIRAKDGGHWSNKGHIIAGKILAEQIEKVMK